jgi:hypothetical protein
MNLSYKLNFPWGPPTNFPEKVMGDIKIHSMRSDPKRRWKKGKLIHHATGVRTPKYHCFLQNECTGTQETEIKHYYWKGNKVSTDVIIDGRLVYHKGIIVSDPETIEQLAKNDGFDSVEDFFKWFDSDFSGVIVHWTDFRY